MLGQEVSYQHYTYRLALQSFLAFFTNQRHLRLFSDLRKERILFLTSVSSCSRAIHWSGRKIEFVWAVNKFFSLMSWMDNLVLLLCPARFLLGDWEWPNMLAASLYIVFCRRSSHSVKELQLFSFLYTVSSSCAQRSSFALPQAIGVFMLKPSRSFFSLVRCELVVWVFSWLVFSILSFTASQEEISSRTTSQSFTRAAVDTFDLDDVEIDLLRLRSPQSFEDMLLRCGYRMMVIINAQVTKKSIPGCLALGIRLLIFTDLPSLQRFACD